MLNEVLFWNEEFIFVTTSYIDDFDIKNDQANYATAVQISSFVHIPWKEWGFALNTQPSKNRIRCHACVGLCHSSRERSLQLQDCGWLVLVAPIWEIAEAFPTPTIHTALPRILVQ